MSAQIMTIPMGMANSYLLRNEGAVLIDTGDPGKSGKLFQCLERNEVDPGEIKLIIITHAHMDHIGSARIIRERTGARLAVHSGDRQLLEEGKVRLPPGATPWGKFLIGLMSVFAPLVSIEKTEADIVLEEEAFDLSELSIPGKIVHTPGHTPGSVSVLLDTGEAFVGDSAFNAFPMTLRPGLPVFAHDIPAVKRSLKSLIEQGAKTIYPSHGKPFPADVLKPLIA